jgi:hypothetical protein
VQPPWNDDDEVAKWVGELIDDAEEDAEYDFAMLAWDTHPGIKGSELYRSIEADAVKAAQGNNFGKLADMLENPMVKWLQSKGCQLGPQASALAAARLRGQLGPRGRPKKSDEDLAQLPVRYAVKELKTIERILREHYPKEEAIRDRAITIAAEREGIERGKLEHFLRSRHRHRLP